MDRLAKHGLDLGHDKVACDAESIDPICRMVCTIDAQRPVRPSGADKHQRFWVVDVRAASGINARPHQRANPIGTGESLWARLDRVAFE